LLKKEDMHTVWRIWHHHTYSPVKPIVFHCTLSIMTTNQSYISCCLHYKLHGSHNDHTKMDPASRFRTYHEYLSLHLAGSLQNLFISQCWNLLRISGRENR
jgi:hypothetical protein